MVMQLSSMQNFEKKAFGTAQKYILLRSLLSYKSEIYSSPIRNPNKSDRSQQQRNLGEKDPLTLEHCLAPFLLLQSFGPKNCAVNC